MEPAPDIIPITDFRRDAAGIIDRTAASGRPVYVTQHGHLTAVLMSRSAYESLLHRLEVRTPAPGGGVLSAPAAEAEPITDREDLPGPAGRASELAETRFGLVDPETAHFLAVEGFGGGPAEDAGLRRAPSADRRRRS